MTTFFSYLKTHKLPPRSIMHKVLARPLTWYGVVLYALIGAILLVVYIFILHLNNQLLVTIPARGGIVTEGVIGAPHVINPVLATTDTDIGLTKLVYSGLLKKEDDGTFSPDLAQSYTVSPDGLTYTFTLKNNLKWSDGKPLASDDVAFTVTKLADPSLHPDSYWQGITVSTPDPHTVMFTLLQPRADFMEQATIGIIPEHIWSAIGDDTFETASQNAQPVGSGPYRVTRTIYRNGVPTEIVLKRNKHDASGTPYIDEYKVAFFANQDDLLNALNSGAVNMTLAADPATAAAFRNTSLQTQKVASSDVVGLFELANNTAASDTFLAALDQSIDKNAILATVENGYGILPDAQTQGNPVSVADTLATLQTLGFTSTNGILQQNGTPVNFSIAVENDPELLLAAHAFAGQMSTLGIAVTVKAFDRGTFQNVLRTDEYPLFLDSIHQSDIPSGYKPAIPLYTKAYPLIFDTSLHITLPEYLDSPADRYTHIQTWYARTNKVWRFFLPQSTTTN